MVDWLDPRHLLTTGLQVLVWRWVGQGRPMEETPRSDDFLNFEGEELWFDYLADTGDGWDSTFTMASLIAQRQLTVEGDELQRGQFLVLGGDAVYPVPSRQRYRERFWGPFWAALPHDTVKLLAIPGNHDWYDALVSFSREFTQGLRVGGWQTAQAQSYFAARLPHGWWLWALDVTRGVRMDYGQREYFKRAAAHLRRGHQVILLAAEPDWIHQQYIHDPEDSHLWTVEEELITPHEATVHVWLAGDLHHYRRHERVRPEGESHTDPSYQKITSGGGGAYLTATHRPSRRTVVVDDHEYVLRATYPSHETSARLGLMVAGLAIRCWKFGVFPMGPLYWLLTWMSRPATWPHFSRDIFDHQALFLWAMLVLGVCIVYAEPRPRWFRWTVGIAHGVIHVWVATAVTGAINATFLRGAPGAWDFVTASLLNFLAGVVFGPTVLGLYLWISLTIFGTHGLEAFSSLRIADYKHFIRFHVDPAGRLHIYPIAVRKITRRGQGRGRYHLIERVPSIPGASPASP